MKSELKLTLSFFLGIVGIILLISNLVVVMFNPVANPSNVGELISKKIRYTLGSPAHFLFIIAALFSFFGIFLGIKVFRLKTFQKKIVIITIILNFLNLLLSLIIAWLLFGLARGM